MTGTPITFKVNARQLSLTRQQVEAVIQGVVPESVQSHAVVIGNLRYPVKQVFALATGLDRLDFTSAVARRQLSRLGFELVRET